MLRRLFLLSLFVFLVGNVSFGNSIYTKEQRAKFSKVQHKIVLNGDVYKSVNNGVAPDYKVWNSNSNVDAGGSDFWTGVSEVTLSTLRNYYELESNGTPVQIWQDPINPNNIHAAYTFSTEPSGWSDRTVQYFYSSDKGVTWNLIGNVPATGRAGFGTISGLSTGAALIATHTPVGATAVRTQIFVDAFPGLGSFANLDPGGTEDSKYIWPRVVGTQNTSLANKFVFINSTNSTAFDSSFVNAGTSITSSAFTGYKPLGGETAETYAIARGSDGRIGIAYLAPGTNDPSVFGDVFFKESTDNGSTFGAATKIYDANIDADSLGMLRGLSLVYQGTSPKVAFETIKQTTTGFFPGLPSMIRFWSPSLPGADPNKSIVIADSNNVPFAPAQGNVDVEGPICRPSIGVSADGLVLFVSMMVQSSATGGTDTTSFNDIYLTASGNNGASWKRPRMVNSTSPRLDWPYASISPSNDVSGGIYSCNIMVMKDVIPGSNVNAANTETNAQPVYWRVTMPLVKITEVSSIIPERFTLEQNYPNPFNPSTLIRFSLPQASNVTLKVFNVSGQEVATLVNNELVGSGVKEVSFNAANLSSGLYFYTITAGNFQETKKMMLIK